MCLVARNEGCLRAGLGIIDARTRVIFTIRALCLAGVMPVIKVSHYAGVLRAEVISANAM